MTRLTHRQIPRHAGFGLIDVVVALTLLAVTLLGACGSLHFALRATRAAAWQARAVDLIADLDEDLLHADPSLPLPQRLESWQARLRQTLPAAEVIGLEARRLEVGGSQIHWFDLQVAWNGMPAQPATFLRLSLAHSNPP